MSEQGNYNVLVEVKKTTIWLRKKDAEKPIDGRIKNQGVIMIENIIETYHGLTTSKPLQLRCFQSG